MPMKNRLRDRIDAGDPVLGAWLALPDTHSAELMSRLGFDWAAIDMQHGLIDVQRAMEMLQAMTASDTTPIVRAAWNDPGIIGKMLDAGAHGIIVPMVNTRAEAEAAAAACRYPPRGGRSFGPFRAGLLHGGNYLEEANEQVYCIPMIETRQALDNLDDILSVPGLDGVYVGPSDLSVSLGLRPAPDQDDETFTAAIDGILDGCGRHGLFAGIAGTVGEAPKRIRQGFRFVEVARDAGSMAKAALQDLRTVRASIRR